MLALLNKAESHQRGYIVYDAASRLVYLTKKAQDILGIKRKEFFHDAVLFDIVPDDEQTRLQVFFHKAPFLDRQGGSIDFKLRHQLGIYQWVRITLNPLFKKADQPACFVGTVRDITLGYYIDLILEATLDGTTIRYFPTRSTSYSGKLFKDLLRDEGLYQYDDNSFVYVGDRAYRKALFDHVATRKLTEVQSEYRVYNKEHLPLWVSEKHKILFDKKRVPILALGGLLNIQSLHYYNKIYQKDFSTSPVTNLPNRYNLYHDFTQHISEDHPDGYLVFVNVDNFSHINNVFGFEAGDQFLRDFSSKLQNNLLPKSKLYHHSADLFVVLMPRASSSQVTKQMKRFNDASIKPMEIKNVSHTYAITSVGIPYRKKNLPMGAAVKTATLIIQKLRRERGKKYTTIPISAMSRHEKHFLLEKQISISVLEGMRGFSVEYYPFIDVASEKPIGAEVLLRWVDSGGMPIPPDTFIPILEELGLMEQVGFWAFEIASLQCKKWIEEGFDADFHISVNVNRSQLTNERFAEGLLDHLQNIHLSTRHVFLEVEESTLVLHFQHGMKQLTQLREAGVRLSMDNFGTGYSSLSHLKRLPIDQVQIDRSFVHNVEVDAFSREFVESIIRMTHLSDRTVCVEGVEEASQVTHLKQLGADVIQGFLYAKPQNAESFESFYRNSMSQPR